MKRLLTAVALAAFAMGTARAATLNHAAVACASADEMNEALGEIGQKDWHALAEQIAQRQCTMLRAGTTVYVVGHNGLLSDVVKIRPRGSSATAWTWIGWIRLGPNAD